MKAREPELKAVVMAGGSGTRFWPLSRRRAPKQFLPIVSPKTMIEETVERILPLIPYRNILTVAGREHSRRIRRLLPRLPGKNALVEPLAKNTAPSLILATASVYLRNPRAVVAVLASDHLIIDPVLFRRKLKAAATARAFLKKGGYYWNSGMFVWRADVFAAKLKEHSPEFYSFWGRTLDALRADSPSKLKAVFREMPATSIDYALMEKADGVVVCEGNFGWSDVGAWSSLFDVWKKDEAGNAFQGDVLAMDTAGTLCFNPGKFTALIGCRDLIVVDTPDALLICPRSQDQRVKQVLEHLLRKDTRKHL